MASEMVRGLGAVCGEIPAASAGMTVVGAGMASEVVWGLGAARGVGFGPQIKFGATDLGAGMALEVVWGLGAVRVEIPAASAGMTEVGARA